MKEKKVIYACIIGEVIAVVGIIVLGILKKPIPIFVMDFYGFCMVVAFIMIVIRIRKNR